MRGLHPLVSSEGRAEWAGFYDDKNLYLLMTVVDASPMKNSTGSSDPAMMLKGGDAVGFCFGPAGGKGRNQRIMTAMLDGRPTAVGYRPDSDRKRPYTFASPVSTLVINDVAPIPEVKVAMTPVSQGYAVGVAIPWAVLGFTPEEGLTFPFDAQVIFSDPGGGRNIATAWWHSSGQGPLSTVDLPTEARIYPDQWGTARLSSTEPVATRPASALAAVPKTDWTITASGQWDGKTSASNLIHGEGSGWQVQGRPAWVRVDMGGRFQVAMLRYLSRGEDLVARGYRIYVTDHKNTAPKHWGKPVAEGEFAPTSAVQEVAFAPTLGRYVVLEILSSHSRDIGGKQIDLLHAPPTSIAHLDATWRAQTGDVFGNGSVADIDLTTHVTPGAAITGYMITETDQQPGLNAPEWQPEPPTRHVFTDAADGVIQFFLWVKDDRGMVSRGEFRHDMHGVVPIIFTLPRACRVSLVISDASGQIVAEPLRAAAFEAGTHCVYWNGRGYRDMPMPEGTYHWRLGFFDAVDSRFYGAAGNSGTPPFPSSDKKGSIGGIHGGPAAVGADAGGVYLLHSGEEGEPGLRKVTNDAKQVLWTRSLGGFGAGFAVAGGPNDRVYMVCGYPNHFLVSMEAASGRDMNMGTGPARLEIPQPSGEWAALKNWGYNDLVVLNTTAYISIKQWNRILTVDLTTGTFGDPISVVAPGRMAETKDSHLLVLSGTSVLHLDVNTGKITRFVDGLDEPSALAVDPEGNVYVGLRGQRQQIAVFNSAGKEMRTIGRDGGRSYPMLKYDPVVFRNVSDLSFDSAGNLWFVESEDNLRRMGCVTTKGEWVRGVYGPVYCSSGMVVNLDDMTRPYYHIKNLYIDTQMTYAPGHRWQDADWQIQRLFALGQPDSTPDLFTATASSSFSAGITFTCSSGKRYLWIDGENTYTRGGPGLLWVWEKNNWVPCATQGGRDRWWSDRNGDGTVQESELYQAPGGGWRWMDRDLTLHGKFGSLSPKSIDARGVPDYQGGVYAAHFPDGVPENLAAFLESAAVSRPAPDGSVYYLANEGPGMGRAFWDRAAEVKLIKVKDGKVQWWAGHQDATNRTDGDLAFAYNICGIEDGVIVVSDVANQYVAYTDDGLTLGWLLKDQTGRPKWSDESYVSAESFSGQFVKDPKTGKYLLFCGASESMQVREVINVGPGKVQRLNGTVQLTSSAARTPSAPDVVPIPYGTWDHLSNGRFYESLAEDWEWRLHPYQAVAFRQDRQIVADLRLRRDAGYLMAFADVLQPSPLNPTGALPGGPGKGDGVELRFRDTKTGTVTRLWLTGRRLPDGPGKGQWQGAAFMLRPDQPPLAPDPLMRGMQADGMLVGNAPEHPIDAASDWQPIPGATVGVRPRVDGHGYRLEAEIPLAILPALASRRPVTFRRWLDMGNHVMRNLSEERYDLDHPFEFGATIFSSGKNEEAIAIHWPGPPASWGQAILRFSLDQKE